MHCAVCRVRNDPVGTGVCLHCIALRYLEVLSNLLSGFFLLLMFVSVTFELTFLFIDLFF